MRVEFKLNSQGLVNIFFNNSYWTTIQKNSCFGYWKGINDFTLASDINVEFVGFTELLKGE